MKPLKVDSQKIEKCEEKEDEEESGITIQQKLLPGGRNEIVYEHTQEKYKCMKRKVDDKWGRTLKYDHHFEWGINLGAEQKVKVGDEKAGAENTKKIGVSFGENMAGKPPQQESIGRPLMTPIHTQLSKCTNGHTLKMLRKRRV